METGPEFDIDQELRRQAIADWIQGSLEPAKRLIQERDLPEQVMADVISFEVRDYQLDAWGAVWDARQAGVKSALIRLATGLGKTSVGVFDVIKFRQEFRHEYGRDPRILFACHKNEILEQAAERFMTFIPDASQGFYNGDDKDRSGDITFATMQSLHLGLHAFRPNEFDYIIYDEAHHAQADTFSKVVKRFRPVFQLALTATPDRMDELDIRDLFGEELYTKGLAEALAEGLLAAPDYHIVFDDAVKEAIESGFEARSLRALTKLFDVYPRNEVIAENIKKEMERIGLEFGKVKTIVFCQNIEHAEEMAGLLEGKAYHSEASAKERKAIFEDFKHGDLQIITTRDMFNEGVDIPDARLLVFLRSTSSKTVFEQQLGRGLRKHIGKERVSVLDFVANVDRIAMIRELADSIKRRSNIVNVIEREINSEITDNYRRGINIHTVNGDFDFDKMTVDILSRYHELVDIIETPTGWITAQMIAKQSEVYIQQVNNVAHRLGIEGKFFRGKTGHIGKYYSQFEAEQIRERINLFPKAIEDLSTVSDLAEMFDVTKSVIRGAAENLNIGNIMRTTSGREGIVFTPDESARIEQYVKNTANNEWINLEGISTALPTISRPTIKAILSTVNAESRLLKSQKKGRVSPHYPAHVVEVIFEEYSKISPAPDGWYSAGDIARELNTTIKKVSAAIKRADVAATTYRARNGKPASYYSLDIVEIIKRNIS